MPATEQLRSLNQMIEQFIAGLGAGTSMSGPALTAIFERNVPDGSAAY